ncbi:protein angel homolog 2 [Salarias fasciatus]|uniref:Protein angel homolog 2-like n=1 Tax=Salarias fasciatus TaxID=181472 RepID=A0A672F4P9_SALFA|nr:protein angel homolog 2-like [Salarias fasciatus]
MFLRRLSFSSVSVPAPPPWWLVWGCRPPPGTPRRGDGGGQPFCTSPGVMEQIHRSSEPPHKRKRSADKEVRQGGVASPETPGPGSMQRGRADQRGPQGGRDVGVWTGIHPHQGHTSQSNDPGQVGGTNNPPTSHPYNWGQVGGATWPPINQPSYQGQVGGATWPPINQPSYQGQLGGATWPPINQLSDHGQVGGANWPPNNQNQTGGANRSPTNHGTVGGADRPPPPTGTFPSIKPLQRRWESCSTDPPPPGGSGVLDFSVMSYNLLSQELLQDNVYLYRHCSPAVLSWSYRLPNLLSEIRLHHADILCLQEVQQDHYENQIRPALQELGYQCEYKKRTGSKPDGCAVVFNTAVFSLVSSNPIEFFRVGDALLDRDNVGQVVLLRPRCAPPDSASFICVANTHLLYNPRRGDVKLAQLAILLAELGRLARLPDGSTNPVLLCGDLNSAPYSPLYKFLTRGRLDYTGLQIGMVSGQEDGSRGQRLLSSPIWSHSVGINHRCQYQKAASSSTAEDGAVSELSVDDSAAFNRATLEHTLNLRSSYLHRLKPDGRSEVTTCHSRTAMTVDYILYTPDVPPLPGGRGLQLLGRLSLVGHSELKEVQGLPNQHHSSDHLPLLVRFRLWT